MSENRKEEIILSTLKLASKIGLRAVSMNMIAQEIGIKKPSLYNHFKSKDELVSEMYKFLREKAKEKTIPNSEYSYIDFDNKNAYDILKMMVNNYIQMCCEENVFMFYKVIYSERAISNEAAKIMTIETETMINATTKVFQILEEKKLLSFKNINASAINFALTIHGIMDYELDKNFSQNKNLAISTKLLDEFILNFCNEHLYKEL